MNTYITRIWKDNHNNFIISDCPDKHAIAVADMIANGGRKLETNVVAHGLGEVTVHWNDAGSWGRTYGSQGVH